MTCHPLRLARPVGFLLLLAMLLAGRLDARRRILGPRHPDVTTSEWNLPRLAMRDDAGAQ